MGPAFATPFTCIFGLKSVRDSPNLLRDNPRKHLGVYGPYDDPMATVQEP